MSSASNDTTLNSIGMCEFNPTKKLNELKIGSPYPIVTGIRFTRCKWPCVVVELKEGFTVFLPTRIASRITDHEILNLKNMSLVYHGEKDVGKPNKAQLVSFIRSNPGQFGDLHTSTQLQSGSTTSEDTTSDL